MEQLLSKYLLRLFDCYIKTTKEEEKRLSELTRTVRKKMRPFRAVGHLQGQSVDSL